MVYNLKSMVFVYIYIMSIPECKDYHQLLLFRLEIVQVHIHTYSKSLLQINSASGALPKHFFVTIDNDDLIVGLGPLPLIEIVDAYIIYIYIYMFPHMFPTGVEGNGPQHHTFSKSKIAQQGGHFREQTPLDVASCWCQSGRSAWHSETRRLCCWGCRKIHHNLIGG